MLIGALIAKQHSLRELIERGCVLIERIESDEAGYALTDKQEYVLVTAFLEGYYSYPRKISAKELAAKLKISSSALTELLRRAELKIITKFIIEEIPHYLVNAILARKGLLKEEPIIESKQ
jgi:predicted DNA binding protein